MEAILKKMSTLDVEAAGAMELESDQLGLPVNSAEDLKKLNDKLQEKCNQRKIIDKLLLIGGSNVRQLSIRLADAIMTKECLGQICWAGTNSKGGITETYRNVLEIILFVIKKRFSMVVDVGTIVEGVLKNKFRNCQSKTINKNKKKRQTAARCNYFVGNVVHPQKDM